MTEEIYIVSAPSGAGKTSVIEHVMDALPRLAFSVSHTTRPRRDGEVDGEDYTFVSEEAFDALVRSGAFVEHTVYSGARYGTTRGQLEDAFAHGNDVILNVEIEGAASLRRAGLGDHPIVYVFLAPSTLDRLANRLRSRGTEPEEKIRERIAVAAREMNALDAFDYLVINDDLADAVSELAGIVTAERARLFGKARRSL